MTVRRVVLDVADAPKSVASTYIGQHKVDEETLIGETDKNAYGYSVAVKSVRLDRHGLRVRIECIRDGEVRRHIDLTSELVSRALPLLRQAAELGGPVETLRDGEWWTTCSSQELRRHAAELSLQDAELLLSKLNAASTLANQAVELSRRAAQDVARAAVVQAKRQTVRNVVAEIRHRSLRHKDGPTLLMRSMGIVLRERLGADITDALFEEAKNRIPEEGSP